MVRFYNPIFLPLRSFVVEICSLPFQPKMTAAGVHPAVRIELDEGEIFPLCGAGRSQHTAMWEYVGSF